MPPSDTTNALLSSAVFSDLETRSYSGGEGDYMDAGHHGSLALSSGTISLSFSVADLPGDKAILSKDGSGREDGGHFTVWVQDGMLVVTLESATETEWLKVPDLVLTQDKTYQLGLTFGDEGLKVWLDGELVAAEPQFKHGIEANDRSLVIGGTRAWRDSDSKDAHTLFEGEIGNVMIFDQELGEPEMLALAAAIDPGLDDAAAMAAAMEDLMPVLGDMHHGSETLQEILMSYGISEHGHFSTPPAMLQGTDAGDTLTGGAGSDGINGGMGNDLQGGGAGDDILQGGYGNDILYGGDGSDILDGGHGEDRLVGGDGNDLLISRADGREGAIWYDPDRDEGDPYNELTGGKLYPDQPIPADDTLTGGAGRDIFYFQTLINAKERYIEKHTRDDGSINWHGVAGENDKLHDHWVDVIGNDVVMDFNRGEGDRIVIEGHTTEIAGITYGDVNADGIMDHSVIELYSDQGGGGGAHNDDRLGTITVYGDLVKDSDIEHTAKPAYGIVHTIDDLEEALTPAAKGSDTGPIAPPDTLPNKGDLNVSRLPDPVFGAPGSHVFATEKRAPLVFEHSASLDLVEGTIAFNFSADELVGFQVLFSKDATGYGDGGHITAYLDQTGTLTIRFQDQDETFYLKAQGLIEAGKAYDVAVTFGELGIELLLDGVRAAYNPDVVFDMTTNTEHLIVGANGWSNTPGEADKIHSHFNGTISDFVVLDEPLTGAELLAAGVGTGDFGRLGLSVDPIKMTGTDGDDNLMGDENNDTLSGGAGNNSLNGFGGNDVLRGGDGDDTLNGGDGKDTLNGGEGDDEINGGESANDQGDTIYSGGGHDTVYAGYGNDLVYGQDGDDVIIGGFGSDNLQGQQGDDTITGSALSDMIFGGDGNDFINGGFGHDRLNGGAGADKFYHLGIDGHGSDWVQDYSAAEGDVLVFGQSGATADEFQINFGHTSNSDGERSGDDNIAEAFVIYKPTGEIIWALVDGAGQNEINLNFSESSDVFDLMS